METGAFALFRPPRRQERARALVGGLVSVVGGGAVLFSASLFFLPRTITYRIEDGMLTAAARYSVITERRQVALAEVESVEPVRLGGSGRRTFGTAMPGFCVGEFSTAQLGKVWLATNCSQSVVVVRGRGLDRPLVLSPRDRQAFLQAMASGTNFFTRPAPVAPGEGITIVQGVLALALVGLPFLAGLFFLAPGRLRYLVWPGELEVAGLVRRRRWRLSGTLVRRYRPDSAFRLIGTALPGYYIGLFRMGGETVRVAATHLGEGVLVDGPRRAFLTPEDVDAFLTALEQAGAVRAPTE